MRKRDLTVGIFLIAGVVLFSVSIFLIGSQRKIFSPSFEVFAAFADLDGLMKGARVQVGGSVAGEVTDIVVPESPGAPLLPPAPDRGTISFHCARRLRRGHLHRGHYR